MNYPEVAELRKAGHLLEPGPKFRCFMVPVSPDNVLRQAIPAQMTSKVTYRLFCRPLPKPHAIGHADRIRWRDLALDVIGEPMILTVAGRVHHLEVYLGVESPVGGT